MILCRFRMRLLLAAKFPQAPLQRIRPRASRFQSKDESMCEIETGSIHIALLFPLIGGFLIKRRQGLEVISRVSCKQAVLQRRLFHAADRPFSIWPATQRWKIKVGESITGENLPPSKSVP